MFNDYLDRLLGKIPPKTTPTASIYPPALPSFKEQQEEIIILCGIIEKLKEQIKNLGETNQWQHEKIKHLQQANKLYKESLSQITIEEQERVRSFLSGALLIIEQTLVSRKEYPRGK